MNIENIITQRIFYLRRIGIFGEENRHLLEQLKRIAKKEQLFQENTIIYGIAISNILKPKNSIYDVCIVVSN